MYDFLRLWIAAVTSRIKQLLYKILPANFDYVQNGLTTIHRFGLLMTDQKLPSTALRQ